MTAPTHASELGARSPRDDLRTRIRRSVDVLVFVGAVIACFVQMTSFVRTGAPRALLIAVGLLGLALSGLAGWVGRARWTPTVYMLLLVVGNVIVVTLRGPLLGLGTIYPCAITFSFMFQSRSWRWGLVAALTATPVVIGALCTHGVVEVPTFQFADVTGWGTMVTAAVASMITLAVIVGYAVRQLETARVELEQAHAFEREARTEREQIERELAHAQRADLIAEIAAEVGADIGAQLTIISARAEALARTVHGDAARDGLADVIAAASTATSTMRSLTVFAAGAEAIAARCDAARIARELPQFVRRTIPERIALVIEAPDQALVALDPNDLVRILSNLVLNARDAIPDVGAISLRVTCDEAIARIEVRDDGVGMDAATRARLFQPFFTTKPVGRGTGLGLATAKILVERAGGTLELISEPGRGTCFTIRLPLA